MSTTVKVKYIGVKPQRTDTLYGTGITWHGAGDIKDVPAEAWDKLRKHPDIWCLAEGKPEPPEDKVIPPMLPAPLESMSDAEIHYLARDRAYQIHNRLAGENLRKKFAELERADPRVSR